MLLAKLGKYDKIGQNFDGRGQPMKPQHSARKHGKPMKSELVMILVAMASALVLMGMLIACIPYYDTGTQEIADPEPLLQQQREQEQEEPPEEPPTEETQMPTVPPEKNPYNRRDFQFGSHNYLLCTQQDSYPGIDVSSFQGLIDWKKVKASGIRFAMIRLGYRGYGQAGNMVEDDYARRNLEEARKAGLEIGAYFFSQATTVDEVDDEIFFFMKILGDTELTMPIVLDWERVGVETARTNNVDAETLTAMQKHFCKTMVDFGYTPMVYFNWHLAESSLYLSELEDYPFWLALYQNYMTYPFRVEMWQYTCTGRVPGIQGDVDINVYMPDPTKIQ